MSLLFEILRLFTVKVVARAFVFQWRCKKFCLTVSFIHPEEDRQVGRNIGVLQKRVSSSFVFSILFYEETINTYWMLVKDFICIYIYI